MIKALNSAGVLDYWPDIEHLVKEVTDNHSAGEYHSVDVFHGAMMGQFVFWVKIVEDRAVGVIVAEVCTRPRIKYVHILMTVW